jgi:hypothetical protein
MKVAVVLAPALRSVRAVSAGPLVRMVSALTMNCATIVSELTSRIAPH